MSARLRLLWLTPEAPNLDGSGGAIRCYHQIQGLARRGVSLTVVAPTYPEQARAARTLSAAGVELALAARPRSQAKEALRGLATRPALAIDAARHPWLGLQAGVFWTRLERVARRYAATGRYDAVIVEHDFAAQWAASLPPELPAGLAFQNAYWRYYERLAHVPARLEARRFRAYVTRYLPRYAHGFAVSEQERDEIRELAPMLPVDVVPNGVDTKRLARLTPGSGDHGALVFVGTLSYPPNVKALLWFCRRVFPLVRAARPEASLTIIGRGAPQEVRALGSEPGVTLTGWVTDVAPYMEAAQVAIAPLQSGGGTNLKVVEALAAGRPLVATSLAADGFDVTAGEHLLVADKPRAFADAVLALIDDGALRRRLAVAGREVAVTRYDWDALAQRMFDALGEWLG
jgi:glycosyltransferase involved in cell wall biosynthesis